MSEEKQLKILRITFCFSALLAVSLIIVDIVLFFNQPKSQSDKQPIVSNVETLNLISDIPFEELTKDEAYIILETPIQNYEKTLGKILPVALRDFKNDPEKYCIELDYSSEGLGNKLYDLDYSSSSVGCLAVSFNEKYIKYNSRDQDNLPEIKLNNLERNFVFNALPIIAISWSMPETDNFFIHSNELSETSEKYILATNYLSMGANRKNFIKRLSGEIEESEDYDNYEVAINLFRKYIELDKATGKISWIRNELYAQEPHLTGEERYVFHVKSFPLAEEEYIKLIEKQQSNISLSEDLEKN